MDNSRAVMLYASVKEPRKHESPIQKENGSIQLEPCTVRISVLGSAVAVLRFMFQFSTVHIGGMLAFRSRVAYAGNG